MKEKRSCEAEYHVKDCLCQRCQRRNCADCHQITLDHFTPKCIAKGILHWKPKQTNSDQNTQWLSRECHQEKDHTTPDRLVADKRQSHGRRITLEDVKGWADESIYNKRTGNT
jgi:hypothetical protein